MDIFEWENGTVVERPYVEIDGVKYYIQDGTVSGGTPVTADNLNEMQNILNDKLLNIDYNEIKNKPIIYKAWSQSVSFELPIGRQALVLCNAEGVLLIWNPADRINWNAVFGDSEIFNVSRASNNTTITVSRSGNASWSAFILK